MQRGCSALYTRKSISTYILVGRQRMKLHYVFFITLKEGNTDFFIAVDHTYISVSFVYKVQGILKLELVEDLLFVSLGKINTTDILSTASCLRITKYQSDKISCNTIEDERSNLTHRTPTCDFSLHNSFR